MKIEKVLFHLPSANEKVSRKFGIEPLTHHELFVLYAVNYLPMDSSQMAILRHASNCHYIISPASVSRYIHSLHSKGLIALNQERFTISSLGREFLSAVRRYLLNKRL
jgi:hypothetical protein